MLLDLIFIIILYFLNFYLLKINNEYGWMYFLKLFFCLKIMGVFNKILVLINKNVMVVWEEYKLILLFNGNLKFFLCYNKLC